MCLFVKDGCNIEIAQKDIITFKKVVKQKNNCWKPPFVGFELYKYNKVLTARECYYTSVGTIEHLQVINGCFTGAKVINEGFHSWVRKTSFCNKICVIPKGTEICYGDNNDIVSLHIIVFENKLSYLKYRIVKLFKRNIE